MTGVQTCALPIYRKLAGILIETASFVGSHQHDVHAPRYVVIGVGINVRPRPGLLAIFPAHVPHNMHPYMGDKPFVHIVAQVRIDWPRGYFRR